MYEHIKILLVEDEAPLLGAMTVKLKKAGFTVLQAYNGREGLEIAMKEFPNIVITDIVMPEMDGLQMIQNIRKDKQWGVSVPIILLTNLNDFNHVATAMEYGVHDYLVKSNWKLKDLLETVKNKLNLTQESQTTQPSSTSAGSNNVQVQNNIAVTPQPTLPSSDVVANISIPTNPIPTQQNTDQPGTTQPTPVMDQTNTPINTPTATSSTDGTQQPTTEQKNPDQYFS
ncbi:response regulator [Candidatus Dojkabacteria bacterium]|nr:response regulator [Candidatus Dojkabacteria bacterium]